MILIFTEGEGDWIKSRLPFKIFSTLVFLPFFDNQFFDFTISTNFIIIPTGLPMFCRLFELIDEEDGPIKLVSYLGVDLLLGDLFRKIGGHSM